MKKFYVWKITIAWLIESTYYSWNGFGYDNEGWVLSYARVKHQEKNLIFMKSNSCMNQVWKRKEKERIFDLNYFD